MQNEFSYIELRMIQNLLPKKSYQQIAEMIDRTEDEVRIYAESFTSNKSIVTAQSKIDKRQKISAIKKLQRSLELKNKENWKRGEEIAKHQRNARKKIREPVFITRAVDYSQLLAVRVDQRTIIYAKPGEDIEQLKMNYRHQQQQKLKI